MNSRILFLLDYEPNFDFITQDSIMFKQQLDKRKDLYEYEILSEKDFYNKDTQTLFSKSQLPQEYQFAIPIGSIQFVATFLKIFYGIEKEESIEIPPCLRKPEFLKRYYQILSYDHLPTEGNYFIKDASDQKSFSYIGDVANMFLNSSVSLNKTHKYVVSEIVDVFSEFRIYVIRKKIANISFYKGNPEIFPDLCFIKNIIAAYLSWDSSPQSFSFDVMVTKEGTSLIEVHSFISLGLYWTKWDESLIQGYIDSYNHFLHSFAKCPSRA